MSSFEAEELQRENRLLRDQKAVALCDIERLQTTKRKLEDTVERLTAELSGTQESLRRSNAIRDELEQARDEVDRELRALKEAVVHTIIKLPGGNEVTLEEARGMVQAHEKIES